MKKIVSVAIAIGLLAGFSALPADAKKPKKVTRVAEGTYDAPPLVVVGTCAQTGAVGCVSFATSPKERYFSAEVTDQHGQPVYVSIGQDTNGDSQDDATVGAFCGKTTEPIPFDPSAELHFWVGFTPDPGFAGCAPGIATSGSIKATFSNLP